MTTSSLAEAVAQERVAADDVMKRRWKRRVEYREVEYRGGV
jgi:hypothetical protein